MTQTEKLQNYLEAGRSITAPEARARFGVQNLRARICEMRNTIGLNIGTIPYTRKNGISAVKYYITQPVKAAKSTQTSSKR